MSGAVAIWVKTPGLSPVKTRLAAGVGAKSAGEFYRLSVQAVEAVVKCAAAGRPGLLTPYWAVAEDAGAASWRSFAVVPQGEGGLGTRLSRVYDALLARHAWVLFIGADAPQITAALLGEAADATAAGEWVLGPATDGGFYLFGGGKPLMRDVWESVTYSAATTASELAGRLGRVRYLPELFDVDTAAELAKLRAALRGETALLPAQRALLDWMDPQE